MIRSQSNIEQRLKVTASILNVWQRFLDTEIDEKFAFWDNEEESLEDAISEERNKRWNDLVNAIARVPQQENVFMKRGKEFEDKVCLELSDDHFSRYAKNGSFQVYAEKDVEILGYKVRLLGYLDILKSGRIMDVKRVVKYSYPKYTTSHQHPMYLFLVPEAIDFTYLIADDRIESEVEETRNKGYHLEHYTRDNCENILDAIEKFFAFLKCHNLWDLYVQKWSIAI